MKMGIAKSGRGGVLRGHHDPDLLQKVLAGKCHSPTLSQFGRSLILQVIVSHRWVMHLGDIKGAFLEANVRDKGIVESGLRRTASGWCTRGSTRFTSAGFGKHLWSK